MNSDDLRRKRVRVIKKRAEDVGYECRVQYYVFDNLVGFYIDKGKEAIAICTTEQAAIDIIEAEERRQELERLKVANGI